MLAAASHGAARAAAGRAAPQSTSHIFQILDNPTSGDEFAFRNVFHQDVQTMSNRLFAVLAKVLGGQQPSLNFVASGSPLTPTDMSATETTNTINIDPFATAALVDNNNLFHSGAVQGLPHEMAHLRQVITDPAQREGGAQWFADYVTPIATAKTNIAFTPGYYDSNYADYVQQVKPLGTDWLLGGQFGHPPVAFP